MKRSDKLDVINWAIQEPQICRCYFTYDESYYHYYYPNMVNEKFMVGQMADQF